MMHVTARQLQQLHATGLPIVLPYRAKLTPMARDLIRQKKIQLGYADVPEPTLASTLSAAPVTSSTSTAPAPRGNATASAQSAVKSNATTSSGSAASAIAASACTGSGQLPILWWCQGNCGPAKAALAMAGQAMPLLAMELPGEDRHTAQAVATIASSIARQQAQAAVIIAPSSGLATMLANKHSNLRAISAGSLAALDVAIAAAAPNVLVLESAGLTLMSARNMILRFLKSRPDVSTELQRVIEEAGRCA